MAQSYAGFREEAGGGESDAYAGSEFNHGRTYDKLIVISRSGTTSEVVDLLKKSKIPSLVITGVEGSPVTKFATESIIMEYADEKSLIQTRWATAVLGLLRAHDGLDLMKAANDAEIALKSDLGDLVNVEQITFLGRGWTNGLAQEAGLKLERQPNFGPRLIQLLITDMAQYLFHKRGELFGCLARLIRSWSQTFWQQGRC